MADTFDVMVKGEKKGVAFDVNPVVVNTDDECRVILEKLKKEITLSKEDCDLVDLCLAVTTAKDDDDVNFGPGEIVELGQLADKYPSMASEIMACSHHLTNSIDCEGELPPGIFIQAAMAYGELSNIMSAALKSGPITSLKDEVSDEDFEEENSDDEE